MYDLYINKNKCILFMKMKEVCDLLGVSNQTVYKYCSEVDLAGNKVEPKIRREKLSRKVYYYNDDDVYRLMGRRFKRGSKVVVYGRVSQQRARGDLVLQLSRVRSWGVKNGYMIDDTYSDICPGFQWDRSRRRGYHSMLHEVFQNKVDTILVESSDRLGPGGYVVLEQMLRYYNTHLVLVQDSPYGDVERKDTLRDMSHVIRDLRDSIVGGGNV